ncbi:hypothetical protein ACHQM5_030560 [Ranunculus cassubicifolius]
METMARYSIPKHIHPIPFSHSYTKSRKTLVFTLKIKAASSSSSESDEWSPVPSLLTPKRSRKTVSPKKIRKRLITISTSADGKWKESSTTDYVFSLEELRLGDLAEDGHRDAQVFITLNVEKHASFGFSVHGRIITLLNRICICCSCSYCREIDTTFDVWVLPSRKDNRSVQLPEIGGDDPSVIYVKPGADADLDSLIQDTIRLTTSVKETCSETCEKSEQRWQCSSANETSPVVDGRWSTLLELKKKVT